MCKGNIIGKGWIFIDTYIYRKNTHEDRQYYCIKIDRWIGEVSIVETTLL